MYCKYWFKKNEKQNQSEESEVNIKEIYLIIFKKWDDILDTFIIIFLLVHLRINALKVRFKVN